METSASKIRSINENFIFFYIFSNCICSFTVFLFYIQFLEKRDTMTSLYFSFYMIQGITSNFMMLSYKYSHIVKIVVFDFILNITLFLSKVAIGDIQTESTMRETMITTLSVMLYIKCIESVVMIYCLIQLKRKINEKCPICLEDLIIDEIKTICDHSFHHRCLYEWVITKVAKKFENEDIVRDPDLVDTNTLRNETQETRVDILVDCPLCRRKMNITLDGYDVPGNRDSH